MAPKFLQRKKSQKNQEDTQDEMFSIYLIAFENAKHFLIKYSYWLFRLLAFKKIIKTNVKFGISSNYQLLWEKTNSYLLIASHLLLFALSKKDRDLPLGDSMYECFVSNISWVNLEMYCLESISVSSDLITNTQLTNAGGWKSRSVSLKGYKN